MGDLDNLVKDINDRLTAINQATNEQAILSLIKSHLSSLDDNDEFVRKIRFGMTEAALVGSKFSRWGLHTTDVEFLYDLMNARQRAGLGPGPSEELKKTFTAVSEAFYVDEAEVKAMDRRAIDDVFPRVRKEALTGISLATSYERATRAMDSAESGFGQQLIGAQYVRDLWEAARAESRVFGLIDTFEMTDPTAFLPVEVDIPEPIFVAESTVNNASNYATVKTGSQRVQVSAKKLLWHQMWSRELEEDSIVPFVPFLRRQMALALSHFSDSMVLNGDDTTSATGNINSDDQAPAATKYYLAFDGIRHAALVDNTANVKDAAGALTLNQLRDLRGLMIDSARIVDWGHPTDANDLVFVCDVESGDRIALLDEVIKAKQMLAPNSNLLNGEVGRIIGHPVITSMAVSKTAADGKADAATPANNVKGQVVAFNRRGFKAGWRRRIRVEVEPLPATDQTRIVYSARLGFGRFTPTGAASGIEAAAVLYDISL